MKGKNGRIQEQKETRNFATYCNICESGFEREKGLTDHMEKKHRKDGFVCDDCKRGVTMKDKSYHGDGKCAKISSVKQQKSTKKEKKLKKKVRPEGYVY